MVTVIFLLLPSVAMAVIFTFLPFPGFFVFTLPDVDTVAYFVLLLVQISFLLAPLAAVTFAFSFSFCPAFTVRFLAPAMVTFFTTPFMDLIQKVAVVPLPSAALAVIMTHLPPVFFFTVTTPD